jgi:hypothetical protein
VVLEDANVVIRKPVTGPESTDPEARTQYLTLQ